MNNYVIEPARREIAQLIVEAMVSQPRRTLWI
jgi:hypothetical protein